MVRTLYHKFLKLTLIMIFKLYFLCFPKVEFCKVFTLIKNLINIYNFKFFLIFFNNFSPMKFNKFKYFCLMFLKI